MTENELKILLQQEIKVLSSSLEDDDYTNGINKAVRETGFALPNTTESEMYWLSERAKRHCLFTLWVARADKFHVKQIRLNQKFQNLGEVIKRMDEEWKEAQNDVSLLLGEGYKMFGTRIDAGFAYEPLTGRDITYDPNQKVIINPSSNDS